MRDIPPSQLSARCQNRQPDGSHEPFCLELFRRAIVEGCSLSWHYLYNYYYFLVRYWVSRRAVPDSDAIDDLTQEAFTTFWRFYTPEKLTCADGLQDVLAYLKSCAASAVAQANRRAGRAALEVELDDQAVETCNSTVSAEVAASQQMMAQRLWAAVEACCNDERDRLVVRLVFVAGLKPRQIAEQYPDRFPDVAEVYRVKRNLCDRLRRDPTVQAMRENGQDERLIE